MHPYAQSNRRLELHNRNRCSSVLQRRHLAHSANLQALQRVSHSVPALSSSFALRCAALGVSAHHFLCRSARRRAAASARELLPCVLRQVLTAHQQFVHLALPNLVVVPTSTGQVVFCFQHAKPSGSSRSRPGLRTLPASILQHLAHLHTNSHASAGTDTTMSVPQSRPNTTDLEFSHHACVHQLLTVRAWIRCMHPTARVAAGAWSRIKVSCSARDI